MDCHENIFFWKINLFTLIFESQVNELCKNANILSSLNVSIWSTKINFSEQKQFDVNSFPFVYQIRQNSIFLTDVLIELFWF